MSDFAVEVVDVVRTFTDGNVRALDCLSLRVPRGGVFGLLGPNGSDLGAPNSETAQAMTFPLVFPLTFASSIFVPVQGMPGWLRVFARNQPVTQAADAVRGLMRGTPLGNSTWLTLRWAVAALAVLAPLATSRYRRAT